MKRIYFTTVIRKPKQKGKVGHTYAVDWDTKAPLWEKMTSSVRGMSFVGDRLLIATGENEIKQIDTETGEQIAIWTYPELGKLHKIYYRNGELILTSCGNDSRAVIDVKNMSLLDKVSMSGGERDSLHFNSIGWDADGQEYHVYHKPGKVVNAKTKETIFSGLKGAHDLEFIDDYKAIINDSSTRRTLVANVKTGKLEKVFEASDGPSTTVAQWGFTRGAAYHSGSGMLFTGSSPVDIHMLETGSWARRDWLRLSSTRDESIFDILLDPRDWT